MSAPRTVLIIGGGPAGLMAAETLAQQALTNGETTPLRIELFDAMPSLGRKFLMAGKGGMNITHSEPAAAFGARYGSRAKEIAPLLEAFGADAVRAWIHGLGLSTFVGSSGRVFPTDMKAAPLLRAWLHRLRSAGVHFHVRHRWHGITPCANGNYQLAFATPAGDISIEAEAVILALGGGSWPQLGSDGRWVPLLAAAGLPVAPLRPANCGFEIDWSAHLRERFAGQPLKNVSACFTDANGTLHQRQGECLITASGIEGGLIYALSAPLRDAIEATGSAVLSLDLLPAYTAQRVADELAHARGARSLSSHLQSRLGLKGAKVALLHEGLSRAEMNDPPALAAAIKALPLRLRAPRPIEEAISSAGGVLFEALDRHLMSRTLPGVFCAGEMLDWEAPTGGYLLTACLACGRAAGQGALEWIQRAH
jgi:uncharacterized flavoprotein (TIGR03862 family)